MTETVKILLKKKSVIIPAFVIILLVLFAIFIPIFSGYSETGQDLSSRLMSPGNGHIFGTDELGRDVFTRIFYGTRVSIAIAIIPTLVAIAIGTAVGIVAAYFGNWVDFLASRFMDIMLSIPSMLLSMVVLYTFGGSIASV